mmetsp:Transcript_15313/g.21850  ORF Transcript_15313/g.21850 Transcript_15313/m.21850 type:complete len:392 (-) Transcript_15313:330-1505(-)|eukprot:CAMPEP_0184861940 /NCGR_PEP_ID=MMETSP0580-20130426/6513_1 /TAXON_ID=1118495 /ORGANISM="Dactyliosolen fragilissimus" /LENGTH=391 /DNA_ID=CAMNT_0027359621 /DNA_START=45 /DNA_END=1220 /DNA_ORIENTATION=-
MTTVGKAAEGVSNVSDLLNQPIVIDMGTSDIKAGFAGLDKPKVVVGTKVGEAKYNWLKMVGREELKEELVGSKLDEHRGAYILKYPMEKGYVTDWDDMEKIWEHVFSKLDIKDRNKYPVLLTEPPLNPSRNRERIAEIFFEKFGSPALFFAPPAVLSLYAAGRTTGVVLDVGEGVSHCVPVYEGFALHHSVSRSDIAGRDVTENLQLLLRRSGIAFTTTAEADLVKNMKEKVCYVSSKAAKEENIGDRKSSPESPYQLPDGSIVNISSERYMAPEILFNPMLIGSEEMGVADTLMNSIMKSDIDLRPTLFSQVVLAGGSTCTPGFGERLLSEIRSQAPAHTRIKIVAPAERIHSAWVGGSILSSLATFKNMWVTRKDHSEYGDSLLHRGGL